MHIFNQFNIEGKNSIELAVLPVTLSIPSLVVWNRFVCRLALRTEIKKCGKRNPPGDCVPASSSSGALVGVSTPRSPLLLPLQLSLFRRDFQRPPSRRNLGTCQLFSVDLCRCKPVERIGRIASVKAFLCYVSGFLWQWSNRCSGVSSYFGEVWSYRARYFAVSAFGDSIAFSVVRVGPSCFPICHSLLFDFPLDEGDGGSGIRLDSGFCCPFFRFPDGCLIIREHSYLVCIGFWLPCWLLRSRRVLRRILPFPLHYACPCLFV